MCYKSEGLYNILNHLTYNNIRYSHRYSFYFVKMIFPRKDYDRLMDKENLIPQILSLGIISTIASTRHYIHFWNAHFPFHVNSQLSLFSQICRLCNFFIVLEIAFTNLSFVSPLYLLRLK